jgi:hypothetical protein
MRAKGEIDGPSYALAMPTACCVCVHGYGLHASCKGHIDAFTDHPHSQHPPHSLTWFISSRVPCAEMDEGILRTHARPLERACATPCRQHRDRPGVHKLWAPPHSRVFMMESDRVENVIRDLTQLFLAVVLVRSFACASSVCHRPTSTVASDPHPFSDWPINQSFRIVTHLEPRPCCRHVCHGGCHIWALHVRAILEFEFPICKSDSQPTSSSGVLGLGPEKSAKRAWYQRSVPVALR